MDKRLLHFQNNGRERDIFSINEDRRYLQKMAASKGTYHPKIEEYIQKAKPLDNLIQVLITAMGAYPFWQQNVNGDRFLENSLSHTGDDYGWKTFLSGNYFTHHVNKDPALAKGEVLAAVWNEKMKRVELILGIDPARDPDGATAVSNGENLAFSMGAKLPYDVCSVCANKAKNRGEYCDHLKYQMNQIDPVTGMLIGAINPYPKFFDISRVLIPADKTAYMWEKVASAASPLSKLGSAQFAEIPVSKLTDMNYLTEKVAHIEEEARRKGIPLIGKSAAVQKSAEIKKIIPTTTEMVIPAKVKQGVNIAKLALDNQAPNIDMNALAAAYSLPQIISTMLMMGMMPKASESHTLGELFAGDAGEKSSYGPSSFSPELAQVLMPYLADRSFARPVLLRRIIILSQKEPGEIKKMAAQEKKDGSMNAGVTAGILAALAAMFHPTWSPNAKSFGRMIADHPFIAMAIGASVIRGLRELQPEKPIVTGEISLADPTRGFYNNDWQRRFVNAQSRPVTVIKTGADHTIESQIKQAFAGLPAFFMLDVIPQQQALDLVDKNPLVFNNVVMNKEAREHVSNLATELMESASRIVKTASLQSPEFLEMVPDHLKNDIWDLSIVANVIKMQG